MQDKGEHYDGCICVNGKTHPDCPIDGVGRESASVMEIAKILLKREEKK